MSEPRAVYSDRGVSMYGIQTDVAVSLEGPLVHLQLDGAEKVTAALTPEQARALAAALWDWSGRLMLSEAAPEHHAQLARALAAWPTPEDRLRGR